MSETNSLFGTTVKKTYYSISEVCAQTELEPHVLRYWESEFPQLRPKKNRAGNRAYRERDIETVRYIKHLLYEEKFTIPGAKKKLAENRDSDVPPVQTRLELPPVVQSSAPEQASSEPAATPLPAGIVADLQEILRILRS